MSDPTTIEFAPPAQLLNMNQRLHWTAQRRIAREWRAAAQYAARNTVASASRQHPPCTVAVMLPVPDRRQRDPHNYFPTVKHIIDGLVDAGIWPNDTPTWVTTIEPALVCRKPPMPVTVMLTPRAKADAA